MEAPAIVGLSAALIAAVSGAPVAGRVAKALVVARRFAAPKRKRRARRASPGKQLPLLKNAGEAS